jgi:hypothetical protein
MCIILSINQRKEKFEEIKKENIVFYEEKIK